MGYSYRAGAPKTPPANGGVALAATGNKLKQWLRLKRCSPSGMDRAFFTSRYLLRPPSVPRRRLRDPYK